MDPRDLGWLTGIIDGEGCFTVASATKVCYPRFFLASRYDDFRIPQRLSSLLGCGRLYINEAVKNQAPVVIFGLSSCRLIVETACPILDQCQFMSKKAVEYPLWKTLAKLVYQTKGNRDQETIDLMIEAKAKLSALKKATRGAIPEDILAAIRSEAPL